MLRDLFSIEEVIIQNLWNFELGSQETMYVPIKINIEFQQRGRQDSQDLSNDSFCSMPVTSAQAIIRTEKNSDTVILLNYNDNEYSQGYAQNKEAFRASTKDDSLQPYIMMMILDLQIQEFSKLDIIYMFSIYDTNKSSQLPKHLK